jgi:hypothetical protein
MDSDGALANMLDIVRLEDLERQGYFKPGFAAQATIQTCRYVERICLLRAVFAVLPYPGPTVTE